ncbi:MAG: diacylglycerol/lipid kinase family protein [Cytophagaceae bacterium]
MLGKNLLFVINPIAGGRNKEIITSEIKGCCREVQLFPHVYETTGKNDHQEILKQIEELRPDAVIAVGGDGTVNLVGNVLVGTDIPLGIIPAGSANGLAKDLNIPLDFDEAIDVITSYNPRAIDTLIVNGRNCFHLSDFGFNARVVKRFSESIRRGKLSYLWYGLLEFFTYHFFEYRIVAPNQEYAGRAFMMIITNANKFGTNIAINPLGTIDDGTFEISIIKPFPKILAPYILYHLLRNSITTTKYYRVFRCKQVTILNKHRESFHIDGEPIDLGTTIHVKINPGGLKVLLP